MTLAPRCCIEQRITRHRFRHWLRKYSGIILSTVISGKLAPQKSIYNFVLSKSAHESNIGRHGIYNYLCVHTCTLCVGADIFEDNYFS